MAVRCDGARGAVWAWPERRSALAEPPPANVLGPELAPVVRLLITACERIRLFFLPAGIVMPRDCRLASPRCLVFLELLRAHLVREAEGVRGVRRRCWMLAEALARSAAEARGSVAFGPLATAPAAAALADAEASAGRRRQSGRWRRLHCRISLARAPHPPRVKAERRPGLRLGLGRLGLKLELGLGKRTPILYRINCLLFGGPCERPLRGLRHMRVCVETTTDSESMILNTARLDHTGVSLPIFSASRVNGLLRWSCSDGS